MQDTEEIDQGARTHVSLQDPAFISVPITKGNVLMASYGRIVLGHTTYKNNEHIFDGKPIVVHRNELNKFVEMLLAILPYPSGDQEMDQQLEKRLLGELSCCFNLSQKFALQSKLDKTGAWSLYLLKNNEEAEVVNCLTFTREDLPIILESLLTFIPIMLGLHSDQTKIFKLFAEAMEKAKSHLLGENSEESNSRKSTKKIKINLFIEEKHHEGISAVLAELSSNDYQKLLLNHFIEVNLRFMCLYYRLWLVIKKNES